MVKIVLNTGVLDVAENVGFPITFNIGDIRDLSSRKGTFSKSIVLEGTKNNHELLGHYYDVNIQAGTFNINALTKCQVIQNGVPILDDALLQLVSVNKVQNNHSYEDEVNYNVLIKDSRAEFFSAITNSNLTDLDFSDLNHIFDSSAIVSSFSNTLINGYKYIMPMCTGTNVFQSNEFKPAIYAQTYFDRIFSNSGFTYQWGGLAAANFDKLLIPYNGDVNDQDYEDYKVEANNTWTTSTAQAIGQNVTFQEAIDTGWSEVIDTQSIYDPTTGQYTSPFNTSAYAGEHYVYSLTLGGTISLDNTSGVTATLIQPTFIGNSYNRYRVYAVINIAGQQNTIVFSTAQTVYAGTLPTGSTNILSFSEVLDIPAVTNDPFVLSIAAADIQVLYIGVQVTTFGDAALSYQASNQAQWRDVGSLLTNVSVNIVLDLSTINMVILPSNNIQVSGSSLIMNQYVPVEVKQSDFVKSILQMYNLYVEQDVNNPYNLILRHRDEYYDKGAEKNWSEKLAKDKPQELLFLPDVTKKKLKLTYAADTDQPNVLYTQATGEIYGQIEYTFDNEYVKDVETQELIFSPTPVYRTLFDAYVPALNGSAPNTNLRILFDGGEQPCQQFDIVDFGTTGQFGLTNYPMLGHFNNALTPTFDINFGTNDYYFYETETLTANNLYNLYWRRTVNQINVGKMLIAYFYLDELDIQTLKLNDKIYIDNSWWNINKIQDYNANNNSLTKVELISIDTEIDLAAFKTGKGKPIGDTITAIGIDSILRSSAQVNNIILSGADAMVFGKGNTVTAGTKGVIIGDGKVLSEDGMTLDNLTVTGTINGAAIVNSSKYIATISQVSTLDPILNVLENGIGDIVWTRVAAGRYHGTLMGAFPNQDRLYLYLSNSQQNNYVAIFRVSADIIEIITYDLTNTGQDNMLDYNTIEIRTY
jgi:hypothetical protein